MTFKSALELHFQPTFKRELRPPSRPVGSSILKVPASATPPAAYPAQWRRLRSHLLTTLVRQSAKEKERHLQQYGKTLPAMIEEMDALHEQYARSKAVSVPAAARPPPLTAQRLQALMVDAEQKLLAVVDSGANASMCFEGAPSATGLRPARWSLARLRRLPSLRLQSAA